MFPHYEINDYYNYRQLSVVPQFGRGGGQLYLSPPPPLINNILVPWMALSVDEDGDEDDEGEGHDRHCDG